MNTRQPNLIITINEKLIKLHALLLIHVYIVLINVVLGADFVRRSTVLHLKSNDVVTINVKNNGLNRQSQKLKIIVNGFLYNPSHKSPVVWSVHSTTQVPLNDSAMEE